MQITTAATARWTEFTRSLARAERGEAILLLEADELEALKAESAAYWEAHRAERAEAATAEIEALAATASAEDVAAVEDLLAL